MNIKTKEKKHLEELTMSVVKYLNSIESIMEKPANFDRGKAIAQANNYLEFQNDSALHFGLGYSFKKITRLKLRKAGRSVQAKRPENQGKAKMPLRCNSCKVGCRGVLTYNSSACRSNVQRGTSVIVKTD